MSDQIKRLETVVEMLKEAVGLSRAIANVCNSLTDKEKPK